MSHPHYNPYASGNQRSNQGQYRASSVQPDRDLRRDIPGYGPGSSFNPPPASSATPANHGGSVPSLLDLPVIYRPEPGRARENKVIERSVELHVSRAREEVRGLDRPAQPVDQSPRFTHTQSDVSLSSGTGTTSYPMSSTSASVGRRHVEVESGRSSLDWLPKYKRSAADDSTKSYSLPASSSYTSSADVGRFKTSSDRERDGPSIPGLGDYVYPAPDKPAAPTETRSRQHTTESAANILLNFGLEKEDLEFLISYPEEQITPDNLPFLLRQIRTHKANRAMTAVESKPFPQPQPSRVVTDCDILSSSGGSSAVLQPNKVIEYGHTSKYVGGVLDDIGRTSGRGASSGGSDISLFLNEQRSSSSDSRDQLKTETEMRRIPAVVTRVESSSVPPDRSSYTSVLRSVAPVGSDPVQPFQTQPDQTPKPIFNSFSIPKKDANRKVFTSEPWEPFPLKAPETKPKFPLKSQQSSNSLDNVYPGRRGLVVIDKIYSSDAKDESATRGQDSGFSEAPKQQPQMQHVQKQQKQQVQMQHVQKQQEQQVQKQPAQKQPPQKQPAQTVNAQTQQPQKQPVSQLGLPTVYPPVEPSYFPPVVHPPASLQPSPNRWSSVDPGLVQVPGLQNQPSEAVMFDYAAATPTVFPHTCSLCYKKCCHMKDWISHQNSTLHLNSCKYVRTLYPQWSGEILPKPSDAGKDATPSASASRRTSQRRDEKTSAGRRSRSPSPRRRHRPGSSREKRSLSRSSRGSSYGRSRSRDRSRSRSYERSRKRERRSSSRRRSGERRSSPRRRGGKRSSPRRSKERRSSPRRSRERLLRKSSPRKRSEERRSSPRKRSEERRSSPRKWSEERRSSPRRSRERRSSPRKRSEERQSSPRKRSEERRSSPRKRSEERRSSPRRRREERRSSPRRRDERRSSVRRSRERRSSSESSSERRSSSADRLVKKVLEKSDVKSLSKPSDVEAVVKTLFAEIAKLKSAKRGTTSKSTSSAGRKSSTSAASSSSAASKAKKTTARDEDPKQKTTPQQVVTKDQAVAEGSTKETGAKVSTQQVSKKPRSEPTHVSEVTVKVEAASSSREPKTPVDNMAETKGRDTKDAKSKLKPQAEGVGAEGNQSAGAEPKELGETGSDVAESMEVESCAEGKGTNVEAVSDKSSESQPATSKDETGPPAVQTADEASSQVPEPESTEPESTEPESTGPESTERSAASGLGTKMEDSRPTSPTEDGERNTKDPESAEENQKDPRLSSAGVHVLTIGEKVEEHFHPNKLKCLSKETAMSQKFCRTLLISNLPRFHEGCYTEDDVAGVFVPFGLESWSEEIYVVPQARVAFVVLPSALSLHRVLSARPDVFAVKENRLLVQVLGRRDSQSLNDPIRFYIALMKWMGTPMEGDEHRLVLIRNISPSEAGDLREALREIGSVSNYLPLLNKVFIEFESGLEADRLGVWCSLLKQAPSYTVVRLTAPYSARTAHAPEQPVKAIPHGKDAAAWATTPSQNDGVPRGSRSPFWITMSASPFVFPTMCPWFSIPKYQTVSGYSDIEKLSSRGTMFPTLMLTAFPEGRYRQEDVDRLVRPYFPKQTLHLYNNVVVLTLQRRAFVHFSDWTSCCDFVKDSIREPVVVRGCVLMVHFVLEDMYPESKEELMYKSMMKWSNSRVPDPQSLEERLLCVEISETTVQLVKTVMKTVASIAQFVSFLPLANRIWVEMADSSGAAQVVEKYRVFTPSDQCERLMFKKVIGFRTLKSLEKHIESSSGASTEARPPKQSPPSGLSDKGKLPVLQTSIPASAEPAGDVPMEDVEKLGAEMATYSTSAPKADEDVDAADGDSVPAASSATSLPKSNETTTEHPPIDQDAATAVLAAVRQHRLAQERTQRGERESSLQSQSQDDQPLNLSDFVTVDEVGDDVEETNPAHEASRGKGNAKKRKRGEESAESCKSPKDVEEADDQIPKDEDQPTRGEEEEDASKVVDSVTDQPTTTESDNKKPDATSRRDDRSSKRSGLRTRASKSEEKVKSLEKQDRVVKRSETPQDSTARLPQRDQDPEEEKLSEMLHSTEELVQEAAATERTDRRRSGRGKKEEKMTLNLTEASEKPDEAEEASYEILDSVEDETATEEPVVMTRSTRGRRGRTTTQKDQTKKEDTPTRGRRTPAKESQDKTPKMEKEASSQENSPTKKSDITVREEIDVEDEVLQDDRPPTGGKRKRGRRKKAVKSTRKNPVTLKGDKDESEKEAGEEKVSCQIVDSVEDEMVEDQPPTEESLQDKEEEPVHQIVDSVEDVQEGLMTTEETKGETCPKEEEAAVQEDAPTCRTVVEASEKVVAEDLESGNDPSAAEESGVDEKERSLKTDIKEEDTSTTKSQGDPATPAEEKDQQSSGESDTAAVQSARLNRDEVRDEKDDYPGDAAEAEGSRERETREEDGKEPRSRSGKETGKEQEVAEAGEEIRAGELQGLVTLEEIVDADKGEVEQSTLEPRPPIKEDHAVETLDEAGDDEEAEKTTSPVKRRINDDTEESATYVTVDEVEEEGKKEAPRTRGRPKKRTRKTPVRKSTRGKKVVEQAESGSDAPPTSLDASSSLDKDPSTLSSDDQREIQKASLEGAGRSSIDAASAGPDLQPEAPENQRLDAEEAIEASSHPSKRKREPVGPEAKRSRSLSPSVSADIELPPFSPGNPLGPEFLVPKLGYFCNLCHVFCVHESSARDTHCSSRTHYDNLQKHYEKLQPEPSKGTTGNSQASFSD